MEEMKEFEADTFTLTDFLIGFMGIAIFIVIIRAFIM